MTSTTRPCYSLPASAFLAPVLCSGAITKNCDEIEIEVFWGKAAMSPHCTNTEGDVASRKPSA